MAGSGSAVAGPIRWSMMVAVTIEALIKNGKSPEEAAAHVELKGPCVGYQNHGLEEFFHTKTLGTLEKDLAELVADKKPGDVIDYHDAEWVIGGLARSENDKEVINVILVPFRQIEFENDTGALCI